LAPKRLDWRERASSTGPAEFRRAPSGTTSPRSRGDLSASNCHATASMGRSTLRPIRPKRAVSLALARLIAPTDECEATAKLLRELSARLRTRQRMDHLPGSAAPSQALWPRSPSRARLS